MLPCSHEQHCSTIWCINHTQHTVPWFALARANATARKQPTFYDATTDFPRNDVWETSEEIPYWWRVTTQIWVALLIGWNLHQPIRNTNNTQIWVVTRHQYGISARVSQTSFCGQASGGVTKYRLFSQATLALQSLYGGKTDLINLNDKLPNLF